MSILAIEVLPEGIIFCADRNITITRTTGIGVSTLLEVRTQTQRPKVLRWPNSKALAGYVGLGEIGGKATDIWLYEFMGRNITFPSIKQLAETLKAEVEAATAAQLKDKPHLLAIQIAGFDSRDGILAPAVYGVRNYTSLDASGYKGVGPTFYCLDDFWSNHGLMSIYKPTPSTIKDVLKKLADANAPFWFHQGIGLAIFNTLEGYMKFAVHQLQSAGAIPKPSCLMDWEKNLKFGVLSYGAYFSAFKDPGEQFVGGGADVVSIPWP